MPRSPSRPRTWSLIAIIALAGGVAWGSRGAGESPGLSALSKPDWSAVVAREASWRLGEASSRAATRVGDVAIKRGWLLASLVDAPGVYAVGARVDAGSCSPDDLARITAVLAGFELEAISGALELLAAETARCLGDRERSRRHYRAAASARRDLAGFAWRRTRGPDREELVSVDADLALLGAGALGSFRTLEASGAVGALERRRATSALVAADPSGWLESAVDGLLWSLLSDDPERRVSLRARWIAEARRAGVRSGPTVELLADAPDDPVVRAVAFDVAEDALRGGEGVAARRVIDALGVALRDVGAVDAWAEALRPRSAALREAALRGLVSEGGSVSSAAAWSLVRELRKADQDAAALVAALEMRLRFPEARPDDVAAACAVLAGTLGLHEAQRACLGGLGDRAILARIGVDVAVDLIAAGAHDDALGALSHAEPTAETWYWRGRAEEASGRGAAARSAWGEAVSSAPLSYHGLLADRRLTPRGDEPKHSRLIRALRASSVGWWVEPSGRSASVLAGLGLTGAARDEAFYQAQLFGRRAPVTAALAAELLAERGEVDEALWLLGRHVPMSELSRAVLARIPGRLLDVAYPTPYDKQVAAAAAETGVDRSWILAVSRRESGFDPDAVSFASARGLMQVRRHSGRRAAVALGVDRRIGRSALHDPALNLRLGAAILASVAGCPEVATASYVVGHGRVRSWLPSEPMDAALWLARTPYPTVRRYVEEVLAARAVYAALLGDPEPALRCRVEPSSVVVVE